MNRARLAFLVPLIALAACAGQGGDYPSLAVRDAERWTGTMAAGAAQPYVPAPPGAPTLERTVQLAAEARSIHTDFLAAVPNARSRVAAAQGTGSESWAVAQVALADLEARRSRVMVALADLDLIYADASSAGEAIAPVADDRDAVAAMVDEESALIAELLARLAG